MRKIKKLIAVFLSLALIASAATGCSNDSAESEDFASIVTDISEISIPAGTKIIGFGEATHGNKELQELKKDVFKSIMESYSTKTFILEGDFGGCERVNEYIHGGNGTAEAAAAEIGFAIYRTAEMADLIEWMKNYNQTVSESDMISFYGCDMQRVDNNKELLLDYLAKTSRDLYNEYSGVFSDVTDDTIYNISSSVYKDIESKMDKLTDEMEKHKEEMIDASSLSEFKKACKEINIITQMCQLQSASNLSYSKIRDKFMAENVEWILDYEDENGRGSVFLSGHNGHIEKCSANSAGYTSLGNHLKDKYGSAYFAIGTDILNSTFSCYSNFKDERIEFTVTNKNPLTSKMQYVEQNTVYLDVKAAENSDLNNIITGKVKMLNVGDSFESFQQYFSMFYTISMTPNESYDGIILIKDASPSKIK